MKKKPSTNVFKQPKIDRASCWDEDKDECVAAIRKNSQEIVANLNINKIEKNVKFTLKLQLFWIEL